MAGIEVMDSEDMYITVSTTWFHQENKKHKLDAEAWYHGPIDREEATKRIVGLPLGTFLVRASVKEKRAYAMTVATGGKTYVHIQVLLGENGMCFCSGHQFLRLHDVVEYFQTHKYKDKIMLTEPCPKPEEPFLVDEENLYAEPVKVSEPSAPHESEVDATLDTRSKRRDTVEPLPLPDKVVNWDETNVQQWLANEGLKVFKNTMYANGVNGQQLVKLKGTSFPAGKYSDADLSAFDAALIKLRMAHM